ncbi:hypothetical protein [Streptomyces sp. NPDC003863]
MTSALHTPASPPDTSGSCPYGHWVSSVAPGAGRPDLLGLLDLFDEGFVRDPYAWLDRLRRDAPVHRDTATGLWLVSRYEDIRKVLLARAGFRLRPTFANNASEGHAGLRRVVTRFFDAQRVAAAVPVIELIADELIDGVRAELTATGESDLFAAFAHTLPCRVRMELLGIAVWTRPRRRVGATSRWSSSGDAPRWTVRSNWPHW